MTDFKPGDIVRYRRTGSTLKVLAVHKESGRFWGMPEGDGKPLTYLVEKCTKVEPFFEVGKKYVRDNGDTFEPVRIDTNSDGEKVVYGKFNYNNISGIYWVTVRVFGGWTETEAEGF
jgi:hypothetical protein